ncbi:MAG: type IV toxin-antitoxin system AbiEi family antitoxin [bacterium]
MAIDIRTPEGTYHLACEIKRTFLDRTLTNAILLMAHRVSKLHYAGLLLVAPYIPRPTGELLAARNVNFVDRYGNMRLALDEHYQVLVLGRPRGDSFAGKAGTTPAALQVILVLLTKEESASWPVRIVAGMAGVSKSRVAELRRRLATEGVLARRGRYRIADKNALIQKWLAGYGTLLRPKLYRGAYRPPQSDPEDFLLHVKRQWRPEFGRWAATGTAGAYALQRFYRGQTTTLFVDKATENLRKALRFLPDPTGPVTLLESFGPIVYWESDGDIPVADPWLIYAELLQESDPRALEAAEQIRDKYLT